MVELSVNWPARLDGTCPLQFVATGRVIRSEDDRAAVRIERYEFAPRGNDALHSGPKTVLDLGHRGGRSSGENAGTHTAMYSAPLASGVL